MSLPVATVGSQETAEVVAAIAAVRQDVISLRTEISEQLEKVRNSTLRTDKRLTDFEKSLMKDVEARLDSLALNLTTTRVDIQALALDLDQAHHRVCASLGEARNGILGAVKDSRNVTSGKLDWLTKAVYEINRGIRLAFLELGKGVKVSHNDGALVASLEKIAEDINSTVCKGIDKANDNINSLIVDTRGHLHDRLDELQEEVESSRRRTHEKLNNVHEALAGIMNTMHERVRDEIQRTSSLFGSMQPVIREVRKNNRGGL
ncbi:hypothetical protein ED733_003493 [Metarhizium rileyi]|uniref:Uncharacterized protein n=1 Tax=Metarhizium rileyi (strain RCEF 4871) TaxID=1649241 RepID=A0A5C6GCY8_METRR|nr:hypothetical protein ED733_003493 [Metarhizium rileyi]